MFTSQEGTEQEVTGHLLSPLTICGAPTAGKSVLRSLLEGNEAVFCTPLWHDNVSVALCSFARYMKEVPKKLADGLCGNDLRMQWYRRVMATEIEWDRLEAASLQGFYIFHLSGCDLVRLPISFDFYAMDKAAATAIWNLAECTPPRLFHAIFSALHGAVGAQGGASLRYAVSIPANDFHDYKKILQTYPHGRVIYVDRDVQSALGSTINRRAALLETPFLDELKKEFTGNNTFLYELIQRSEEVAQLQAQHPDRVLVINFEELILHTEKVMRKVCEWLAVPFTPAMVKATFRGEVIDERAVGSIQDDMDKILDKEEARQLGAYIDLFKQIRSSGSRGVEYSFPASFFGTKHEKDSAHNIIVPLLDVQDNIFNGPYLPLPPGKWRVTYCFECEGDISSLPADFAWSMDGVDTTDHCYFRGRIPVAQLPKNPSFDFIVTEKDRKFEFRAYGKRHDSAVKVRFLGVKVVPIEKVRIGKVPIKKRIKGILRAIYKKI